MKGLNRVQLLGYLGADAEIRFTQNGDPMAIVRVATTDRYRDQNGQLQSTTEWHRVILFGNLAKSLGELLKKGMPVFIEGKLRTRKWEDKNGNARYTTEIIARNVILLPSAKSNKSQGDNVEEVYVDELPPSEDDFFDIDEI